MFTGESFVTFKTNKPMPDIVTTVKEMLRTLGSVQMTSRGSITISPGEKYQTLLVDSTIGGELKKGQNPDEFTVRIDYKCLPSIINWIISVAGTLMCLVGFLALGAPFLVKMKLDQHVRRCLNEIEDTLQPVDGILK